MKKTVSVFMVVMAIFCASTANAQFQLSANGSYLNGTGDNSAHLWGGGLSAKFLLDNTIAIGAGFNTFPKTTSSNVGGTNYAYTNANTQIFGNIDIFLNGSKSMVQPYIGANVGVSANTHSYTSTSSTTFSSSTNNDKTFFYVAPLVGINIGLGQAFGVFAQASYGLTFGSGNTNDIVAPSYTSKPVDKFFQADAGIYIRLVGAKK